MTEENTTPEVTPTATATPPAPEAPNPAAVRAQMLQEKLENLRASRATKKSETDYSSKLKELEERENKLKDHEKKWSEAYKDPTKGFEALGLKPHDVYQRLTDILLDSDTPEVKQRQMLDDLKKELKGGNSPEIENLKKEIEALKADLGAKKEAEQAELAKAAEQEQLSILKTPKFEDLTDFYSEEQLLSAAYEVAKTLAKGGMPYDYESVAQKMLDIHTSWWDNVSKKRASKTASSNEKSESESDRGLSGAKELKSPTAIGNSVASATASNPERPKDKKAAAAQRAKMLKGLFGE